MLTTIDNPYQPSKDYEKWQQWDQDHGYFTAEYLARVANVPVDADDDDAEELIDTAIQEILKNDVLGIYKLDETK